MPVEVNKMLRCYTLEWDGIILRFDDGEVMKFTHEVTSIGCEDESHMIRDEVTDRDRFMVGEISRETFTEIQRLEDAEKKRAARDECLVRSWRCHYLYGEDGGFPKPTQLPEGVIRRMADYVWSSDKARVQVDYLGVTFILNKADLND